MSDDRRRSPRIEILGRLHGHTVAFDVPILVREISLGGMSVETEVPLAEGALQEFLLTLGDGSTIDLVGRVMYCRPTSDDAVPGYVCGVQFTDDEGPDQPSSEMRYGRLTQ